MTDGWVCEKCGEIATGDMCMACGAGRASAAPDGPQPGSYYSILGLRSQSGFQFYGYMFAAAWIIFAASWGLIPFVVMTIPMIAFSFPKFRSWLRTEWNELRWRR